MIRIIKILFAAFILVIILSACSTNEEIKSAEPFNISDVRLLPGPFLEAQQTSMKYILELDMDRLLAPFLKDAGIETLKENYGNWENTGLDGHIGGHYLSSLSLMYAATGEQVLLERLEYMLGWLEKCQDKNGNGYVGGIPDGQRIWEEIAAGNIKAAPFSLNDGWVPLYNIHKLYSGLRDAYIHAGSQKAFSMLTELSVWMIGVTAGLSEEQMQDMLRSEHGGMNEVFADMYSYTKEEKYLVLAERFSHRTILDPLIAHKNELTGMHANTQIPKVIGFKKYADAAHNNRWDSAAVYFWELVVNNWTVSIGGNSVAEHFHPIDDFSGMVRSEQGPETCNTYNMLRLTQLLFFTDPQAKYMDYFERAMYNHILSSQNPKNGGYVYMTPMRPQHYRVYSQPQESFWCCVGSGLENHAKYGEMIYSKTDNDLFINMFIPSTLKWEVQGLELTQLSDFPYSNQTQVVLKLENDKRMKIMVRCPGWTDKSDLKLRINGEICSYEHLSSGYLQIDRKWKNGDILDFSFSTSTTAEYLPDSSNWVSFVHGPIVLAAVSDSANLDGQMGDGSRMGHIASGPKYSIKTTPSLKKEDLEKLDSLIEAIPGSPLQFRLKGLRNSESSEMLLQPFFNIHEARYIVYWPVGEPHGHDRKHAKNEEK